MSVNLFSIFPIKLMIFAGISKSFSFFRRICLDTESYAFLKSKNIIRGFRFLLNFLFVWRSLNVFRTSLMLFNVDLPLRNSLWTFQNFGDRVACSKKCRIESSNIFVIVGRILVGRIWSIFRCSVPSCLHKVVRDWHVSCVFCEVFL